MLTERITFRRTGRRVARNEKIRRAVIEELEAAIALRDAGKEERNPDKIGESWGRYKGALRAAYLFNEDPLSFPIPIQDYLSRFKVNLSWNDIHNPHTISLTHKKHPEVDTKPLSKYFP